MMTADSITSNQLRNAKKQKLRQKEFPSAAVFLFLFASFFKSKKHVFPLCGHIQKRSKWQKGARRENRKACSLTAQAKKKRKRRKLPPKGPGKERKNGKKNIP